MTRVIFMQKRIKEYAQIVGGAFVSALALNLFLVPNSIASGGASGLGTILFVSLGVPVSVTVLGVNIVLFVVGARALSRRCLVKTVAATLLLSTFIELTASLTSLTSDKLLAALCGGVLFGGGTGLTIAGGGSTGGSDLAALIVRRRSKRFSVARLILIMDLFVVILSGMVFGDYEVVLYAAVSMYISSLTADAVIEGVNFAKLAYIISSNSNDIANAVMNGMERGVTALHATGMYSGESIKVLMCAVRKNEVVRLRKTVKKADENAFIILTDAREVLGNGFDIED